VSSGRDRQLLICFAIALVPIVVLAIQGWDRRWMSDDGFINLRVVDQLLHGHGPVFNAGERVEASTSPLWVLLLAATRTVVFFVPLEWIAVVCGLVGSVAGLAMAERGAWLLAQRTVGRRDRSSLFLPVGALVVAALPPFWDFATSGLEGGMTVAWLGASFWALASRLPEQPDYDAGSRSTRAMWGAAVVIGLGPLIRPDLALFSAAFFVALVIVDGNRRWQHRIALGFVCIAAPLAYEVFRMAFFGTLVPNTALAKDPGIAAWDRGADYAWDFVKPYWLWLPFVVLSGLIAVRIAEGTKYRRIAPLSITLAPVSAALVYTLYIVRIGGDFMHARLLLPALFGFMLPVAIVQLRTLRVLAAVGLAAIWALICLLWLRVPYDFAGPHLLDNERGGWVQRTGSRNPVMLDDFAASWAQYGTDAKQRAARGERVFQVVRSPAYESSLTLPLAPDVKAKGVVAFPAIGQLAYAAGTDVYVVDLLGLGDPIVSRVKVQANQVFWPGHNKLTDPSWAIARFADPTAPITDPALADRVANARAAIGCGRLQELLRDTTGSPTPRRLLRSFQDSWVLTQLRFDRDPTVARAQLCR
jgi:arabinofuranosyltransferase